MRVGRTRRIALVVVLTTVTSLAGAQFPAIEGIGWEGNGSALVPGGDPRDSFCTLPPCLVGCGLFDVLVMTRSSTESQNVLFAGSLNNPVLNIEDLGFDAQAGFRGGLTIPSECGCDLQFSYFGVHDMADSAAIENAGVFYLYGFGSPATPASSYTVTYESNLDSAEINIRSRQWSRVAPLAGFRAIQLEEYFNILDSSNADSGMRSDVENEWYGVQFGAEALLCEWGCTRLETVVKAGVYASDIQVNAQASDISGSARSFSREFTHTGFSGELQLMWIYQFCDCGRLRFGYEALWLEGIALAPDQGNDFYIYTGEGSLDVGSAIYQGGYVGLELVW